MYTKPYRVPSMKVVGIHKKHRSKKKLHNMDKNERLDLVFVCNWKESVSSFNMCIKINKLSILFEPSGDGLSVVLSEYVGTILHNSNFHKTRKHVSLVLSAGREMQSTAT